MKHAANASNGMPEWPCASRQIERAQFLSTPCDLPALNPSCSSVAACSAAMSQQAAQAEACSSAYSYFDVQMQASDSRQLVAVAGGACVIADVLYLHGNKRNSWAVIAPLQGVTDAAWTHKWQHIFEVLPLQTNMCIFWAETPMAADL